MHDLLDLEVVNDHLDDQLELVINEIRRTPE